jgi:hypothetical protein
MANKQLTYKALIQ